VKDEVVPVDSSKKKRRLSSRELMIEMSTQPLQTNTQALEEVKDEEEGEGGGEVTVTLGINPMHATRGETTTTAPNTAPDTAPEPAPKPATPNAARARWNKLKHATRASRTFRSGGKQRMKRLSKVMKARQNESGGGSGNSVDNSTDGEVKTVLDVEVAVSMHVDEKTGRRYSCNEATGHSQWLSGDDDVNETTQEEAGESRMEATDVTLFPNPRLDAETVHNTQELSLETTTNNPNNSELELPDDWDAHETEQGDTFYVRRGTGLAQWENPISSSSSSPHHHARNWDKYDDEEGQRYYSNNSTQESAWVAPEGSTGGSTGM
jgi:hypothetical protein